MSSGDIGVQMPSPARPPTRFISRVGGTLLLLVVLSLISKVAGFLREMYLAAHFGAGHEMDAFLVGQTLPSLARGVFDELLGSSLLPLFATWCARSGEALAWAHLKRLLRLFLICSVGLVALGLLFAGLLVKLLAPGLSNPDAEVAVHTLQITLPGIGFMLLGSSYTALLNYYRRFLVVAGLTLAANVAILLCIVLLADRLGVYSAALALSIGALLLAACQWLFLPAFGRREPATKNARFVISEFTHLAKPLAFGIFLFSLIPAIERFLASWLPEGSIAVLNYAFKVDWLVYMVFVAPITTMAFPRLAESEAAGDRERFRHILILLLKFIVLLLVPVIVILLVSSEPVIRLLFERGNFTAARTAETAAVLRVYVLGLPGAATTLTLFYAIYALKQPVARVASSALAVGVAVLCGAVLTAILGVRGIAAAHDINFTVLAVFLGWYLRRALTPAWWRPLAFFTGKAVLAGLVTLPICWFAAKELERVWLGTSAPWQAARLAAGGLVTLAAFLGFCWLFRLPEVRSMVREFQSLRNSFTAPRPEAIP